MAIDSWHESFTEAELAEARLYILVIRWSARDDAYIVSVPELPGLKVHGDTHEEAVVMGEEAVALWIAGLRAEGRPVPAPQFAVAAN